jgi:hypothetical protein
MWAAEAKAKVKIPLNNFIVKKNKCITITRGRKEKYAIWHNKGIFDLPEKYVKHIKVICTE